MLEIDDNAQQSRLAAAGRSDERDKIALGDIEIDPRQRLNFTIRRFKGQRDVLRMDGELSDRRSRRKGRIDVRRTHISAYSEGSSRQLDAKAVLCFSLKVSGLSCPISGVGKALSIDTRPIFAHAERLLSS